MPGTRRIDPSSPSSPRNASPASRSGSIAPPATSTPTAIARSSPAPVLRTPEGARLTVIRFMGQVRSLERSAARTRSRDSRHASSGSPTTLNAGRPLATWTSTETGRPSAPRSVADGMMASTSASFRTPARTMPSVGDPGEILGRKPGGTVPEGCVADPRRPRRRADRAPWLMAGTPGEQGGRMASVPSRRRGAERTREHRRPSAHEHDTPSSATTEASAPHVGAIARWPARPGGPRGRRVPRRPPPRRLPRRGPLLHGVGLPDHPPDPRRPRPRPLQLQRLLGPSRPPAPPRPVAAARGDHLRHAVADRSVVELRAAPVRRRHGDLHRQLVAAGRAGLLLAGVRSCGAAQPHVEPGHRGAVLRDLADHRGDRLEARPRVQRGRCSWSRSPRSRAPSSPRPCSSVPAPTAPGPTSAPTRGPRRSSSAAWRRSSSGRGVIGSSPATGTASTGSPRWPCSPSS